ncbi:hypothetical protein SCOR_34690 [Sulfidibacter corallicola]|uniref:Uncharacterized protein n=1 Tax=Sulfidibacter corallicola TaxID=2818388 RepID=A0A8A4TIJ8_SULCO|nr:hypothetical protein [Sulfidibacter corallicola]QTD49317.1 hypothetical protein J3U87_27340 [Sulfidibacter corallicola]
MKSVYFLLTTFSLCAFGGIVIPVTVPDGDHRTMEEDFPLSLYVDYGPHEPINHPTIVETSLPMIEILQRNGAYGHIDANETQLPYAPGSVDDDLLAALDFDHDGDGIYWYVDGSRNVFYKNTAQGIERTWRLWGHFAFSEIATTPDSDYVWVYDACRGDLLRLHKRFPWCFTRYDFDRPMEINGLAVDETSVYVVDTSLGDNVIYQFEMGHFSLDFVSSWQVLGFENDLITDIDLMPDDSILIATTHPDLSLVLVEDKHKERVSPIENAAELALVELISLPEDVKQPSGIWRSAQGQWFLTTDQAEVFELDEDFQSVGQFDVDYQNVQCNQGCTEGISGDDANVYVLTDEGYVARYERDMDTYQYREEFDVAYPGNDGETLSFSGLTHRADSNSFFLLSDGAEDQEDILLEVDAAFNELSRRTLSYQGEVEGSIFDYDAAGVQYYDGKIYALSYAYKDLLEISLDGEIQRTFGIDPTILREPSGLFIQDDRVYVVGDHENNEPTPPVAVFALPQ